MNQDLIVGYDEQNDRMTLLFTREKAHAVIDHAVDLGGCTPRELAERLNAAIIAVMADFERIEPVVREVMASEFLTDQLVDVTRIDADRVEIRYGRSTSRAWFPANAGARRFARELRAAVQRVVASERLQSAVNEDAIGLPAGLPFTPCAHELHQIVASAKMDGPVMVSVQREFIDDGDHFVARANRQILAIGVAIAHVLPFVYAWCAFRAVFAGVDFVLTIDARDTPAERHEPDSGGHYEAGEDDIESAE